MRGDKAGAVLHNRFHVIGGETKDSQGNAVPVKDVEVYDPVTNTWQDEGDIPSERFRFMAASHKNKIFIFGGQKFLVGKAKQVGSYYPLSDAVEAFVEQEMGLTTVDSSTTTLTLHAVAVVGLLAVGFFLN